MNIPDTFGFLLGMWRVERSIEDLQYCENGHFEGAVVVVEQSRSPEFPFAPRAHYREEGAMLWKGHRGPARRSLEFVRRENATLAINFADHRFFVDLDLSTGVWCSTHQCGEDLYEISTEARTANIVEERWRVSGRTKSYLALTTLTRLP